VAEQGDPDLARAYLNEALAVARRTGERRHLARVPVGLGRLSLAAGDLADARRLGDESLAHFQEVGDISGVAEVENFLGDVAFRQGEYATARASYTASLQHQQGWQGVAWTMDSLAGLAAVALVQGQIERALRLASCAAAISAQAGYPLQPAVKQTIAAARAALGERTAAAAWAEGEAMTLEQAIAYALEEPAGG
jgi:tetratricopeptide (TPR) repeat protein